MTETRIVIAPPQTVQGKDLSTDQIVQQALSDAQREMAAAHVQTGRGKTQVIVNGVPVPPTPPNSPGFFVSASDYPIPVIPSGAIDIAYGFFFMCAAIVIGWPLARAFGRRIERKGAVAQLPPATTDQLLRIEQAVEAMSIEVERISEAQRYMARIQAGSTAERV